jgi:hypothetical protein
VPNNIFIFIFCRFFQGSGSLGCYQGYHFHFIPHFLSSFSSYTYQRGKTLLDLEAHWSFILFVFLCILQSEFCTSHIRRISGLCISNGENLLFIFLCSFFSFISQFLENSSGLKHDPLVQRYIHVARGILGIALALKVSLGEITINTIK